MRYLEFGSTGLKASEVGFGGIPIIRLDKGTAIKVLQRAFDRGITFYDTANAYYDSEEKMGCALAGKRQEIVLATKTLKRDAQGTMKDLERSLKMLQTDYIDLFQLHQIAQDKVWDTVTAPEGALSALVKAKEQGKIRFIGVTSHKIPMALKLVKTGLFSSIQFPINFIETEGEHELRKEAMDRGLGILGMKPMAGGMIDNAGIAFKYLRQFPDLIPIPGYDSEASVDEIASLYAEPNEITAADLRRMDEYRLKLGKQFCRRCEYCQPCPQGVLITPALAYKLIVARMSPAVAVGFSQAVMESVKLCSNCGECEERCPYELPIQDMLKAAYDMYEGHRREFPGRNDSKGASPYMP